MEANNESVAGLAGVDPGDILMAEWRNSPHRPCHYIAVDRANQCLVLSVRCARGGWVGGSVLLMSGTAPTIASC